jgi:CRISPR-associated endonuclease/helicase Cas3
MINLQSHPNIQLFEHIAQVESAIEGLCDWHSEIVASPEIRSLIQKAVSLHDVGKGTEAFQEYIKNPPAYTGDPMDKSHTPMSLLLTLLLSMEEKWEALDAMMISAVVFGHHKALPLAERLREIGSGILAKTLKRQIAALETEGLKQHCAIDISRMDLQGRPWAKALKYIDDHLLPVFEGLSIEDALVFRLKTQLFFSLLLEADKAFLAVKEPQKYLHRDSRHWMPQWIDQKIGSPGDTPVNKIRRSIRIDLEEGIEKIEKPGIFSLTAPTGSGKTLLSATWLLKLREKMSRKEIYPKAIIVLPFLSVIDQTTKEYESLLTIGGQKVDGSWFLTSHSLSDRTYEQGLEEEVEHFFVDTWRTELIITTYDQFLMALMDSKARYQMRFHNLCDSLIIMDEVQSLPCKLWKPLEEILRCLVRIGNSSILLMSATLPAIISDAETLVENYSIYFKKAFNRYKFRFRLEKRLNIRDFCNEVHSRRNEWLKENKRVLITLNTRRSARLVRDKLAEDWPCEFSDIPLFFLSADVTPRDRLEIIEGIKKGQPCIVVSTQCIEAGVDIDMDFAIRDFAPFDSLVQIAGRCNRNGRISYPVIVEVVDLFNEQGTRYSDMIYDDVHLNVSRQLTEKDTEEKDILPLTDCYFKMLAAKKDTGKKHLERFVRWQKDESVRELLRGKQQEKYTFLVLEQDAGLKDEMAKANRIEDRWKRREAWRALAGRMAKISISVYAKPGFIPQHIATEYLGQWILRDGFYSTSRGLVLDDISDAGVLIL